MTLNKTMEVNSIFWSDDIIIIIIIIIIKKVLKII